MGEGSQNIRQQLAVPLGAASVMLLAAVFGRWPYGFYQLLRLVVCGASIYGAFVYAEKSKARMWILIAAALIFNPIAPLRMSRNDWASVDLLAGIVLAVVLLSTPRANR